MFDHFQIETYELHYKKLQSIFENWTKSLEPRGKNNKILHRHFTNKTSLMNPEVSFVKENQHFTSRRSNKTFLFKDSASFRCKEIQQSIQDEHHNSVRIGINKHLPGFESRKFVWSRNRRN
jgi:hypothetical protein